MNQIKNFLLQALKERRLFRHGYALIIGVNENQIRRLAVPAAAKDVQALYDVLTHPERCAYKPENVKLIKGQEATDKNILDGLEWLRQRVQEDDEATAVIYFSGQAMVDKATNQYYLIPYNIRELSRLRADAIKAETVTAAVRAVKAKRMVVILDCCHAEGMVAEEGDLTPFSLDALAEQTRLDYGWAILNSSSKEQSSYVRQDGRMSLFTYHLIEALTGHASPPEGTAVYINDIMTWITKQVAASAQKEGRAQTPIMRRYGNFPIALLYGGHGLIKAAGQPLPDPLAPLPPIGAVGASEIDNDLNQLFAPLFAEAQNNPAAVANIQAIKQSILTIWKFHAEIEEYVREEDETISDLIRDIAHITPGAKQTIVNLYANPIIAKATRESTDYVITRISRPN